MLTIHGLLPKPVVYCKYLDPVLKYDILEIFGFGLNILYILNIWIRYNVLCNTVHIYIYIVETLQDGVGTPPGATKIDEKIFLY